MSADQLSPVAGPNIMNEPAPPASGRRWSPRGAREALQPVRPPEPPEPPRRRRSGGFLGKLSAFFTLLVFVAAAGAVAIIYAKSVLDAQGPLKQDKVVFIPRGNGPSAIAEILEQEGVIDKAWLFEATHLLAGRPTLKFGEYQFKEGITLKDVREVLIEGKSILHSVTIPEGLTSEQIVGRLRENDILVGEIRSIPKEGALLPDTYKFDRGMSREQLLSSMERAQKKLLSEVWARRSPDIPIKSPNDMVILASIVEKETGRSDERTRVASVFVNRLNRGMRLQSDPTIIYGLVGGKGSLGRGILSSEIQQATPYNTYVINGLPPGPIANPGRASLEATANPSKTRDIFFVADGTGGHAFAETLEQHNRNVARWRQIESGSVPAPAPSLSPSLAPSLSPNLAPSAAPPVLRPGQRSELVPPALQGNSPPTRSLLLPSASAYVIPDVPLDVFSTVIGSTGVGNSGSQILPDDLPISSGGVESYPVAPGRRQSMQKSASEAGANPGLLVPGAQAQRPQTQNDFSALPADQDGAPASRRGPQRGFDAVEGTARDPLRNKSFDLNSPKTVPTLR
jgi:UPF0755 protein